MSRKLDDGYVFNQKLTNCGLFSILTVGKKIIKETQNVKIGRQTGLPTDVTEAQIEPTESKKVSARVQRFHSPRGCKTSSGTATKITKQESSTGEKKSSRKKDVLMSSTSWQGMEPEA